MKSESYSSYAVKKMLVVLDKLARLADLKDGEGLNEHVTETKLPASQKQALMKLILLLGKNVNNVNEILYASVKLYQEIVLTNPVVYLSRSTDNKSKAIYFSARTEYPVWKDNRLKFRTVTVYLGNVSDFKDNMEDPAVLEKGKKKIIDAIKNRSSFVEA